jgi:predicted GNAT family acetyltransferase
MEILRLGDPGAFLGLSRPLIASDERAEARHNLMLGIASTAEAHPELYPTFLAWVVTDGGAPLAAASRTPPFNLVLADPASEDALEAVLEAVRRDDPEAPGLVANVPHAHTAARAWTGLTGATAEVVQRQGVYALTAVRDVPRAPGHHRPARAEERDLLLAWLLDFAVEATPAGTRDRGTIERSLDARLAADEDSGMRLWEDEGRPVSLVGFGSPTPSGIRIGPVYTPRIHRRHGYATSLTAEVSRSLLERGHRVCFLYTDLANPTSNAIYARIGYERVCDSVEYRFGYRTPISVNMPRA